MTNIIYSGENSELYEQSYPYVYAGIRKTDEKIYIGARYSHINDKRSVKDDFGQHYFTSSEKVEFDEFEWEILYISNNSKDLDDVFIFEAELINEHWGQPYLLNRYNPKSGKFNMAGKEHSVFTKEIISESRKEWYANPDNAEAIAERNEKISAWYANTENSEVIDKSRQKVSVALKEYFANPENEDAIDKSRQKQSEWWANPENDEAIKLARAKQAETIKNGPDLFCPYCEKKYKFQKSLDKHIKNCKKD
jgi:hypothetical protein